MAQRNTPKTPTKNIIYTIVSGISNNSFIQVDGDGIFLDGTNTIINFVFDMPVTVTGYGIGFNSPDVTGSIDFLSSGGASSLAEPGITVGTYSLGTPLNLLVGQTLTVSGANLSTVSQMNALTVEPFEAPQATPEPTTLVGLLLVGGVGLLSKRQKQEL